ncbi:tetratricopeptide repeat-containing sulfotransferase family protein [Microbulbifer pacificus]|uniref:Sulfotransferase n=1 Tax=Microbulbifer pacificus TaxID=407164 RepID=A0AAU0N3W0_9GAMM|nr:sulfotransferase [Microbulbifer pacificus]WOX06958.1 sulfotransferase [Microbulbifer pacificus]
MQTPDNPNIAELHQRAVSALNRGVYRDLALLATQLQQVAPDMADGWFFASIASTATGQIRRALELVREALRLDPDNPEYLSQKARCHIQLQQIGDARVTADLGMQKHPSSALLLDTFGVIYSKVGDQLKAAEAFRGAVGKQPQNPQFQFNLGSAEQFLGNLEAARAAYEQAIRLQPDFARAHWALSELEKNRSESQRLPQLRQIQQSRRFSPEEQLYLAHAMARELEREGDFHSAFQSLATAKRVYKQKIRYDFSRDQALFDGVTAAFSGASDTVTATEGNQAIFVLGMPRSGTTLIERVLHSHPQMHSLGELQDFPLAAKRASGSASNAVLDAGVLSGLAHADRQAIGRDYLASVADRLQAAGSQAPRFVDKLPMNFLYLGLIAQCLPGARFVLLKRHPLDTCLSNYRQLFSFQFAYYHYNYALEDTARYIVQFHQLMVHWKRLYPGRIHEVCYEGFTENPEAESRRLIAFCDLPWDERCLDFSAAEGAVSTASSVQVRQPVYRSAVARWKKYERELAPAIEIFTKAGLL